EIWIWVLCMKEWEYDHENGIEWQLKHMSAIHQVPTWSSIKLSVRPWAFNDDFEIEYNVECGERLFSYKLQTRVLKE
ncbi:hypothetical protein ACLOJK_002895, partial [Asimina triloba]